MPVSKPSHSGADSCGAGQTSRNKRPRSQLSNGPNSVSRSHVVSPPGWETGPGSWPPLYIGGASVTGPSINIPDTRYGFSSPRPSRYGQVSEACEMQSTPCLAFLIQCWAHPSPAGVEITGGEYNLSPLSHLNVGVC